MLEFIKRIMHFFGFGKSRDDPEDECKDELPESHENDEGITVHSCEVLDIDYDDVKSKLPDPDEVGTALNALDEVTTDERTTERSFGITTQR